MTTFAALETSFQSSRPVELYSFALGASEFHYTSAPTDIVTNGITFVSTSITRGPIGQGSDDRKRVVPITVPLGNPFAQQYIGVPPGSPASVSVFRYQRDETPTPVRVLNYKGTVNDVKFARDGLVAEIVTRTIEALSGKTIPRYTFASQCQHVLYGPGCDVNVAAFQVAGVVTGVSGVTLTVSNANSVPDGRFRGGICRLLLGGDYRLILAHTGTTLTLQQPFAQNITGANLVMFAGCDHLYAGSCKTVFANQARNGGWNWVPTKNPFATGLR